MTPTEELISEVLIARARLGHTTWTFMANATVLRALKGLEDDGLVWWKYGVVEKTYLVGFTEDGRTEFLSRPYTPPILGGKK